MPGRRRALADLRGPSSRSPSSTSGSSAAPVRPTCSRSRWTTTSCSAGRQPDQGGRGPGAPAEARRAAERSSATSSSARRSRRRRRPSTDATLDDELALLVVHGVLHLLNYDHADPREAGGDAAHESASCSPASASSSRSGDASRPRQAPPTGESGARERSRLGDRRRDRRALPLLDRPRVAETAFTRMSRIRALSLEEEGRKGAHRLAQMLERPERTLNVLLLLILVVPADERVAARCRCSRARSAAPACSSASCSRSSSTS